MGRWWVHCSVGRSCCGVAWTGRGWVEVAAAAGGWFLSYLPSVHSCNLLCSTVAWGNAICSPGLSLLVFASCAGSRRFGGGRHGLPSVPRKAPSRRRAMLRWLVASMSARHLGMRLCASRSRCWSRLRAAAASCWSVCSASGPRRPHVSIANVVTLRPPAGGYRSCFSSSAMVAALSVSSSVRPYFLQVGCLTMTSTMRSTISAVPNAVTSSMAGRSVWNSRIGVSRVAVAPASCDMRAMRSAISL